eukprot:TRINITY_DN4240_c0_g1_i8.p1 TRINITY_DN4240_c0_g1~~TRINITY_DN4240_c0_g1_i8.p1  ORF type:complete len:943 (-),score=202.12 TRINITY_DN4240_c0_g1_i8:2539-5286(-)
MKAGGHELKGLMRYSGIQQLRTPLMALIDYRGFRLVAMSRLPINNSTLVYGSADAGEHVHADVEEFNQLMMLAARKINIKGHLCGRKDYNNYKTLYAPCDIEGHVGTDGEFYVLDLARVFPPTSDHDVRRSYLFKHFRPEFVRSYKKPLSSDAFSKFDGEADVNNAEVAEATEYLFQKLIPQFSTWLENNFTNLNLPRQFAELLHRYGVNIRYSGLVLEHVDTNNAELRSLLIHEMLARVAKNMLREKLRHTMRTRQTLEEDVFTLVITSFLNSILRSNSSFWTDALLEKLEDKYTHSTQAPEVGQSVSQLQLHVERVRLFARVQDLAGVVLTPSATEELYGHTRVAPALASASVAEAPFCVVPSDIASVVVMEKHANEISLAEGNALEIQAMDSLSDSVEAAQRLLNLAMTKFEQAIEATPDSHDIHNNYASVMHKHAMRLSSVVPVVKYLEQALEHYFLARNSRGLFQLAEDARASILPVVAWRDRDDVASYAKLALEHALVLLEDDDTPTHSGVDATVRGVCSALASVLLAAARNKNDDALYSVAGYHGRRSTTLMATPHARWVNSLQCDSDVAVALEAIASSPSLSSLDADCLYKRDLLSPEFLSALLINVKVRTVCLRKCYVTAHTLLSPLKKLGACVTRLDLAKNVQIPAADLCDLLVTCRNVTALDISYCAVNDAVMAAVPDLAVELSLRGCTELTERGLQRLCGRCIHLRRLDLSKIPNLFYVPFVTLDLEELSVRHSRQVNQTSVLLDTPRPSLRALSFSDTELTSGAAREACEQCPHLTRLDISACTAKIIRSIASLTELLCLELTPTHKSYVPDELLLGLAAACPSIHTLALPQMAFAPDAKGVSVLPASLTSLTSLSLAGNQITEEDAASLRTLAESGCCHHLKDLCLERFFVPIKCVDNVTN